MIFESLLNTSKWSVVFWGSYENNKYWLEPKTTTSKLKQVILLQICEMICRMKCRYKKIVYVVRIL